MAQKHFRFKREPYELEVLVEIPPDGKKVYLDLEEKELPEHLLKLGITEEDGEDLIEHIATCIYNFGELFYRPDTKRVFIP